MIHKSVGVNITESGTIITAPTDKKLVISSLYISNKDNIGRTFDLRINKGSDSFYLLKNSFIHGNSLISVIAQEIYIGVSDSITIEPSIGSNIDVYVSYKEISTTVSY